MKVEVDTSLCEGHAQCVNAAPRVFEISDTDEYAHALLANPSEDMRGEVEAARNLCPTRAVIVEG